MKLKALTHMWTIYGSTTQLPKVGVKAEMWDNVWDRQTAAWGSVQYTQQPPI